MKKSHENQYNNLVMVSVIMGSCMDLYENLRCVHNHPLVADEMQLFPFFFSTATMVQSNEILRTRPGDIDHHQSIQGPMALRQDWPARRI